MKLKIQSIHFNADEKLVAYVQEKCNKLDKYFDNIIDGTVLLKVVKEKVKGNKVVEIKLNVPQEQLLVQETGDTFEEAVDIATDVLKRLIIKYKEKIRSH